MSKSKEQRLSDGQIRQNTLRLRPGVIFVIIQWLVWFVVPMVIPGSAVVGVLGGLLGGLVILVWWAFFSRAPRFERWGAVILMIVALIATSQIIHESIATSMQGGMFLIFSIPVMSLALVIWAVASRNLSKGLRRLTMVGTILLASGVWTLLRTEGMTGEARHDQPSYGAGRSDLAAHLSLFTETFFTPRSSVERMKSSPVTNWTPANQCGYTLMRTGSGIHMPEPDRVQRQLSVKVMFILSGLPEFLMF